MAKEYRLKTAFLYNFSRLVEWPVTAFETSESPLNICLIGEDEFGESLNLLSNKKANSRKIVIKRSISMEKIPLCHLLFIANSEANNWDEIRELSNQVAILTISELPQFAHNGGHIRFFLKANQRLSLEVNHQSIKRSNLLISSRILSISTIIED